jgi:hypothetical protein
MKTQVLLLSFFAVQFVAFTSHAQYVSNHWSVYYGGSANEYVEEVATDPSAT